MKKFITSICLILFVVFAMSACSDSEYIPRQEDFEFSVVLEKTEFVQGETLEYTVKLVRKSGPLFKFQDCSTLWSEYFKPVGTDEEPYFAWQEDIVTHTIPEKYEYETSASILTEYYQPGEYLLAARFRMNGLQYDFEQVIKIL